MWWLRHGFFLYIFIVKIVSGLQMLLIYLVCDKKDLEKMAVRLQGWFVTLHEKHHEEKVHGHVSKRSVSEPQKGGYKTQ